jgi:hypothetical protein
MIRQADTHGHQIVSRAMDFCELPASLFPLNGWSGKEFADRSANYMPEERMEEGGSQNQGGSSQNQGVRSQNGGVPVVDRPIPNTMELHQNVPFFPLQQRIGTARSDGALIA